MASYSNNHLLTPQGYLDFKKQKFRKMTLPIFFPYCSLKLKLMIFTAQPPFSVLLVTEVVFL